ncbi:MAG: hypothetical protein HOP02_17365 [Methylococcaceae bacterium]|nr:hypothetical protein [Methylococcaceae bacterium]
MIGGMMIILVSVWVYQSLMRAKKDNVMMWVGACAALFFAVQFLLVDVNIAIMEGVKEDPAGYARDLTSIGDRKNEGGFQGFSGVMMSLFFELFPPIAGFVAVAVLKTLVILKQPLTLGNLFGGVKEMFVSIKDSFKATGNSSN